MIAYDTMVLVAQLIVLLCLSAWLTLGVYENITYPELNRVFTSEVLDMTRMRDAYPDAYAKVSYRRISDPHLHNVLFRLIVVWECAAVLALWAGVIALGLSILGWCASDLARTLALLGALWFTSIWSGFLIAGNWFCYWFCHDGAQNTHFQMALWGLGAMIFLSLA